MRKDRGLRDVPLQDFEGGLLVFGPLPSLILLEEIVERSCDVRETADPPPIGVHETDKFPYPRNDIGRCQSTITYVFLSSFSNLLWLIPTPKDSIFGWWNSHFFGLQKSLPS